MPESIDQSVLLAVTRLEGKLDGVTILHAQEIAQHGREINELRKRQQEYAERTDERLTLVETAQAVTYAQAKSDSEARSRVPLWLGLCVATASVLSPFIAVYLSHN